MWRLYSFFVPLFVVLNPFGMIPIALCLAFAGFKISMFDNNKFKEFYIFIFFYISLMIISGHSLDFSTNYFYLIVLLAFYVIPSSWRLNSSEFLVVSRIVFLSFLLISLLDSILLNFLDFSFQSFVYSPSDNISGNFLIRARGGYPEPTDWSLMGNVAYGMIIIGHSLNRLKFSPFSHLIFFFSQLLNYSSAGLFIYALIVLFCVFNILFKRLIINILFFTIIFLPMFYLYFFDFVLSSDYSLFSKFLDGNGRYDFWANSIRLIFDNPFGIGYDLYKLQGDFFTSTNFYLHIAMLWGCAVLFVFLSYLTRIIFIVSYFSKINLMGFLFCISPFFHIFTSSVIFYPSIFIGLAVLRAYSSKI